ncbi:hypothetical protein HMI55_003757 [Coelomomyces lativittatus]|nr:hypothetical protein HMI55_003757 [Coelomomyces lativittatus]
MITGSPKLNFISSNDSISFLETLKVQTNTNTNEVQYFVYDIELPLDAFGEFEIMSDSDSSAEFEEGDQIGPCPGMDSLRTSTSTMSSPTQIKNLVISLQNIDNNVEDKTTLSSAIESLPSSLDSIILVEQNDSKGIIDSKNEKFNLHLSTMESIESITSDDSLSNEAHFINDSSYPHINFKRKNDNDEDEGPVHKKFVLID